MAKNKNPRWLRQAEAWFRKERRRIESGKKVNCDSFVFHVSYMLWMLSMVAELMDAWERSAKTSDAYLTESLSSPENADPEKMASWRKHKQSLIEVVRAKEQLDAAWSTGLDAIAGSGKN
jgi:hypothetical protein